MPRHREVMLPRQALPQSHRRLAKAVDQGGPFLGPWSGNDRTIIEDTLRHVQKGTQPAEHAWVFTCVTDRLGQSTYAAWQPGRMSLAATLVASSARALAEDLWAYYFERSLD